MCYGCVITHLYIGGIILSKTYPTWTARIPPDIKEYLQNKKGFSAGHCLCEYYKILKLKELPEALKELDRKEKAVLQQKAIVTQLQNENNTNWAVCNTLFKQLCKQDGFDIKDIDRQDKFRIRSLLEKNGINDISLDQFIEHYRGKELTCQE